MVTSQKDSTLCNKKPLSTQTSARGSDHSQWEVHRFQRCIHTSVWCETRHLLTYQDSVVCSKPTVKQTAYVAKHQKFDYNFTGHKGQTQEWETVNTGPRTWGLRTWGPGTRNNYYTGNLCWCYKSKLMAMLLPCTPKALFIADITISNHPLIYLILRMVYCQSQLCTHKARVSCMWPLTPGPLCI